MDAIELAIFNSRLTAICEEMGAVLRRAALSPNIKDRLDYSCAVFDAAGALVAQAAHIPVHLGSMAFAMRQLVAAAPWSPGDMMIVNDPYLGGTHLPDVTLIAPVFADGAIVGFVANRAHHADIGCRSPGSMPLSRTLAEEGLVLSPRLLLRNGNLDETLFGSLTGALANPAQGAADFSAQISANQLAVRQLHGLVAQYGSGLFIQCLQNLNDYAARLGAAALRQIPDGTYRFRDVLDDDGFRHQDIEIAVAVTATQGNVVVDFAGTAAQVPGNINCPLSVTAAAVYYVFRCLMPPYTPAAAGSFAAIQLSAPAGCLINAMPPAAVAAGNVETSTRIVDVVLGALAQALPDKIPAASHGSMNNVAMGARGHGPNWDYYETIGGGMGAGRQGGGLDGVQTHMTNTLNTPVESLEMHFPLRVRRYGLRRQSGGAGKRRGGDGITREFEFMVPTEVTLLTERRRHQPWSLAGGLPGLVGENRLDGELLPGKVQFVAQPGQTLVINTPGGGGFGLP